MGGFFLGQTGCWVLAEILCVPEKNPPFGLHQYGGGKYLTCTQKCSTLTTFNQMPSKWGVFFRDNRKWGVFFRDTLYYYDML